MNETTIERKEWKAPELRELGVERTESGWCYSCIEDCTFNSFS